MKKTVWIMVVGGMMGISPVFAENVHDHREDVRDRAEGVADRQAGSDQGATSPAEVARLRKLKAENPKAFKQAMQEHRQQLRQRLEHLKQTDPKKFAEVKARLQARRQERLERLKTENPEKFRKLMEQRRGRIQEKLQELKANDPAKYEQVMQRRNERLEQFKQNHPEAFERWKANHPDRSGDVSDHGMGQGRNGVGQGGEQRAFEPGPGGSTAGPTRSGNGAGWAEGPGVRRGPPGVAGRRRGR